VSVTARGAAAYEGGPNTRFFYIRRDGDLAQPLAVYYTIGGKAKQGIDYNAIGTGVTIKPGNYLRRVEVTAIDDAIEEPHESVTMTLDASASYSLSSTAGAATIRIISNDEPVVQPLAPTKITWTTRAPSPIIRAEALRAVVDGKVYVFGGFMGDDGPVKRSDVYDPVANTWTQLPDLPTRLTHAGVAVDGRDVYVAGGYVGIGATGYNQQFGTKDVWKFNVDTKQWTAMPQMPVALAGGGAAVIGRMLHYFGGNDSNRADAGNHYALDLDHPENGWQALAALPDPRSHFGTAVVDGKIYAIGGQHGNDAGLTTVATVNSYDPAADMWSTLASLPVAISHIASAATVLDGRIIIAGGETAHEVSSGRVLLFDPSTNAWSTLTPLPLPRFSGVDAIVDGVLYFTTGSSQTTTWKGVLS
jgi:N-acetylneuraminic acid mutarotase